MRKLNLFIFILLFSTLSGAALMPQLVGFPDAKVIALPENGWQLSFPNGEILIFPIERERQVIAILNPASGEITPSQYQALSQIRLANEEAIPTEFLAVPYVKAKTVRLYRCAFSYHDAKILCNLEPLKTVPFRDPGHPPTTIIIRTGP